MVTGEHHSGWTPAQNAAASTALPDGRAAVVADAAYLLPLEQPDAVVGLIRDFWTTALADAPRVER
jgi:pimeloyl-ACP methyl ester carboxylesterase